MHKPELLLPAGNPESFYAAIEGGADAVYLGITQFNARNRAKNFNINDLQVITNYAKQHKTKVYVTLNTLIKNEELPYLLNTLYMLSQIDISSIIIQDWGVYYLVKKHFPKLTIHASTQMGFHNSIGAQYAEDKDFERVIMARELTCKELKDISSKTTIELEVFVHGALCYSFSGMCLFSSYLGGYGANRGLCKQPCRKVFKTHNNTGYFFCLKDNELIDHLPLLARLGISSLKIEGRMRTATYVYNVAKAYRMVIDDHTKIEEAKAILKKDLGREKTSYFFGGNLENTFTNTKNTGYYMGSISSIKPSAFIFSPKITIAKGDRIRIRSKSGLDKIQFKISSFSKIDNDKVKIECTGKEIEANDDVYLTSRKEPFPTKIKYHKEDVDIKKIPYKLTKNKLSEFKLQKGDKKEKVYVRINTLEWLKKVYLGAIDGVFLHFNQKDRESLDMNAPFLKKYKEKIFFELPRFIPEGQLEEIRVYCLKAYNRGFRNFVFSHISQKYLLPKGCQYSTNENVYTLNDAAISFLKQEKITNYIYPFENDLENLIKGNNRDGIVPVYFYPALFLSRMPVNTIKNNLIFQDEEGKNYKKHVVDGLTCILPGQPVSFIHHTKKLRELGFSQFMIDLSFEKISKNLLNKLLNRLKHSQQITPASVFNFKNGLY